MLGRAAAVSESPAVGAEVHAFPNKVRVRLADGAVHHDMQPVLSEPDIGDPVTVRAEQRARAEEVLLDVVEADSLASIHDDMLLSPRFPLRVGDPPAVRAEGEAVLRDAFDSHLRAIDYENRAEQLAQQPPTGRPKGDVGQPGPIGTEDEPPANVVIPPSCFPV